MCLGIIVTRNILNMKQFTFHNEKSGPFNVDLPWAHSQPMEGSTQGTLQVLPALFTRNLHDFDE